MEIKVNSTRSFTDERYPKQAISIQQLQREHKENNSDVSFGKYLHNCMQSQGGTLREVVGNYDRQ